ncbi:MAG: hypothetical protein KGN36_18195 [Acidobacteriota bacterium]|nr:hypothetical protein [Acidobacteriota bacterium]
MLSRLEWYDESAAELIRLRETLPPELGPPVLERALLLLAVRHAGARVQELPVSEPVKRLFAAEFFSFSAPPPAWAGHFRAEDLRYREMARVATFRRFPAGQFQWETAGVPRSWLMKAEHPYSVLLRVVRELGGFSPLLEMHVNALRKHRLILLEREANLSYCRAAQALEQQPAVRGLLMASWMFCRTTGQVTARLGWLRRVPEEAGAILFDLGEAPRNAGFLAGSAERRRLYAEGGYHPRMTCVLWPRRALIEWARKRPEYGF